MLAKKEILQLFNNPFSNCAEISSLLKSSRLSKDTTQKNDFQDVFQTFSKKDRSNVWSNVYEALRF